MHRHALLNKLNHYHAWDEDEAAMQRRLTQFVNDHTQCFERSLLIGHITGSAWVVSPDRQQVVLLHHKKLNRWLQPGGHSDGDPDTLNVALREAQEETGIDVKPVSDAIFDIDIHTIPARKAEPEHEHFDVRFLFVADPNQDFVLSEESNALQWVKLQDITSTVTDRSILRMVEKTSA